MFLKINNGKFFGLLKNGDPHLVAMISIIKMLSEARRDFPNRNNKHFFKNKMVFSGEPDSYFSWPVFQPDVYARAVDMWFERWFGNEMS